MSERNGTVTPAEPRHQADRHRRGRDRDLGLGARRRASRPGARRRPTPRRRSRPPSPGAQPTAPVTVRPKPRLPHRGPLTVMGPWAPVAGGLLGLVLGVVAVLFLAGVVENFEDRLALVFTVLGLGHARHVRRPAGRRGADDPPAGPRGRRAAAVGRDDGGPGQRPDPGPAAARGECAGAVPGGLRQPRLTLGAPASACHDACMSSAVAVEVSALAINVTIPERAPLDRRPPWRGVRADHAQRRGSSATGTSPRRPTAGRPPAAAGELRLVPGPATGRSWRLSWARRPAGGRALDGAPRPRLTAAGQV